MGTRETAQPEVASESWWEVIQGARGAGVTEGCSVPRVYQFKAAHVWALLV